ncbi:hypothetical protein GOBAR_AA38436 [Gossypium barbadense]|uniref:Uncharacterized protein n=1 Tax=Gossypium barbadense TaxID=3634 RepID=A0A2P5VTV7_GOSBA|nr:hypothetical protein GOBAR_AA38436 [Gossypium barbadense]
MSNRGKKTTVPASKKKKGAASSSGPPAEIMHPSSRFNWLTRSEPTYLKFILELYSMFHLQTVMTNFDNPGTVQFCLGDLLCQLSIPEFVGDKVLLDAADPRITTSELNEEIPLTVLSIFPYDTVEVIHPKFDTFKVNSTRLKPYVDKTDSRDKECKLLEPP